MDLLGIQECVDLSQKIEVPENLSNSVNKCRIIYGNEIQRIEFSEYIPRKITSLKLVQADTVDYSYKYEDRSILNDLIGGLTEDDIIIVKNGSLTDASYANLAFYDGETWFTPDTYLLPGTRREQLIELGIIQTDRITINNFTKFHACRLINSMMTWDESPVIEISSIHF